MLCPRRSLRGVSAAVAAAYQSSGNRRLKSLGSNRQVLQQGGLGFGAFEVAQQVGGPLAHQDWCEASPSTSAIVFRFARGSITVRAAIVAHPRLIGKVVTLNHLLESRLHLLELEVANDIDAERNIAGLG